MHTSISLSNAIEVERRNAEKFSNMIRRQHTTNVRKDEEVFRFALLEGKEWDMSNWKATSDKHTRNKKRETLKIWFEF